MFPTYIKTIFLKFLYEFPLIFILILLFQRSNTELSESIGNTFIFIFVLWSFEFLILLKDVTIKFIYYKFSSKTQKNIDAILDSFIKVNFPKPSNDEDFEIVESIFENVDRNDNSIECVMLSAGILSTLQFMMNSGQILSYHLYSISLMKALIRYREICNSRNS